MTPHDRTAGAQLTGTLRANEIDVELVIRSFEEHARNGDEDIEDDHRLRALAEVLRRA